MTPTNLSHAPATRTSPVAVAAGRYLLHTYRSNDWIQQALPRVHHGCITSQLRGVSRESKHPNANPSKK